MTSDWIEYGRSWEDLSRDVSERLVGLLVVVAGETFLVGDINDLRGVCDDCTVFNRGSIVERYRRVYEPPAVDAVDPVPTS